jgi:hypothetical protein
MIKSQSYSFRSTALGLSAGAYDLHVNIKLTSMKQLFFYFNCANCADKTFGAISPNDSDLQFITNGKSYPNSRPIKVINPIEVFMQIRKTFRSVYSNQFCRSIGRAEFLSRDTADAFHLGTIDAAGSLQAAGNKYYLAIDTEIINTNKESMYNGVVNDTNSVIRLNVSQTLTNATACLYWACYDSFIEVDFTTGLTRTIF